MATGSKSNPSFSSGRRWSIRFQVGLVMLVVLSVLVMVNYLSRDYFLRLHVSSRTRLELSPFTLNLLKSITNEVKVTLYYDKNDALYSMVTDLLNEYCLANPRISVRTVDYLRDTAAAQRVIADYKLGSADDKNLVIFDCHGRIKSVQGDELAQYSIQSTGSKDEPFRRKVEAFQGERMFTSVLLQVTKSAPLKAYFLTGHGEHSIRSEDKVTGYLKFGAYLQSRYIRIEELALSGTNEVPMDCNLLVVAGGHGQWPAEELLKVDNYLSHGGRLLAMFSFESVKEPTGLNLVLAKWGVEIGNAEVRDPDNEDAKGAGLLVRDFSRHPVVNPLVNSSLKYSLYLIHPRSVGKTTERTSADAPRVEEVAFTSPKSCVANTSQFRTFPLIAAVDGSIKGVITERGTTRMIVVGDSYFLANQVFDILANRDFAGFAVNWLLDETQLLQGVEPRPITEYTLLMTNSQLQTAQWLLLGAMPGSVLFLGTLVWFRRRR